MIDVAFEPHHLGDVGDAARAVAQARGLDDDVDGGAIISRIVFEGSEKPPIVIIDSRRDRASRGELACSVPIEPSWPVFIACREIERLGSAHLADDDALGAHAQAVLDEVAHGHRTRPSRLGGRVSRRTTCGLLQLKLGRVLAGDDPLVVLDVVGQAVEQRRLAGAGTAGDDDVAAHLADDLQGSRAPSGEMAPKLDELVERQLVLAEFRIVSAGPSMASGGAITLTREPSGEARVADRRGLVDAPADLADDALADVHQLLGCRGSGCWSAGSCRRPR